MPPHRIVAKIIAPFITAAVTIALLTPVRAFIFMEWSFPWEWGLVGRLVMVFILAFWCVIAISMYMGGYRGED